MMARTVFLAFTIFMALAQFLEACPKSWQVACKSVQSPSNGFVTFSGGTAFSSAAFVHCEAGFEVHPEKNRIVYCGCNGTWSAKLPVCNRIQCSAMVTSPKHGNVTGTGMTVYSTRTFTCMPGYQLRGSPSAICLPTGKWFGTSISCAPSATAYEPATCSIWSVESELVAVLVVSGLLIVIFAIATVLYFYVVRRDAQRQNASQSDFQFHARKAIDQEDNDYSLRRAVQNVIPLQTMFGNNNVHETTASDVASNEDSEPAINGRCRDEEYEFMDPARGATSEQIFEFRSRASTRLSLRKTCNIPPPKPQDPQEQSTLSNTDDAAAANGRTTDQDLADIYSILDNMPKPSQDEGQGIYESLESPVTVEAACEDRYVTATGERPASASYDDVHMKASQETYINVSDNTVVPDEVYMNPPPEILDSETM
ncbi:uncharacterized protein LOC135818922 [Sycon ciliatum]|uniref:uncharacterized protein LOC135818922 n=1 Tax=Sycon ciliatum TaxID=27933 RepID=UPI0031F6D88C